MIQSCATYKAKYAEGTGLNEKMPDKEVAHTFYLIGDAGLSPMGGMNPALTAFKRELDRADSSSTALFLGDNIYPAGLPTKKDKNYEVAKNHLCGSAKNTREL